MKNLIDIIKKKEFIFKMINKINQHYPINGIPILLYHRIGTENDCKQPVSCTLIDEFDKEINYLKKNNYYFINIEELMNYINGKIILPNKSVLITFDDGYKNNYIYAFPIIKKYHAKATIFINTNFIGRKVPLRVGGNIFNEVLQDKADVFYYFLSWDEIKEMYKEGIDFQPHGHSHSDLTKIGEKDIIKEICKSKEILEKTLRKKIYFFSYPFGRYNKKVISLLQKQKFKASFALKSGIAKSKVDLWTLPRTEIGKGISFNRFKATLSDYMRWYMYIIKIYNKFISKKEHLNI